MNVADLLTRRARLDAHSVALLTDRDTLGTGALERLVWVLAGRWVRLGLAPGATVALSFRSQALHLIASLAALRAGLAQISIPAGTPDPLARAMIRRTRTVAVVCDDVRAAAGYGVQAIECDLADLRADHDRVGPAARREADPGAPALYVPGSGTTGEPRFIVHTTRGLLALFARETRIWPVRRDERHLMLSEFDFFTCKRLGFAFLAGGGAVVLLDHGAPILESCDRLAIDHLSLVVPHAWRLIRTLSDQPEHGPRLPRLRSLTVGASPVSEPLRRRMRDALSANTWVRYGTNETGQITVATPAVQDMHPGCVGRACQGVELQVVDDQDRPLPPGATGLVRLRADGTCSGYLDDPEATERALRGGWFYPGDVGRLADDGTLIFGGRADDLMIFDGINVHPREIESVLESHPAVVEAAAFPVASEEHHQEPVAAVEVSAPVGAAELIAFCRERLGARAPTRIVVTDELPRNPGGKVLKRELARLAVQPTVRVGDSTDGRPRPDLVG